MQDLPWVPVESSLLERVACQDEALSPLLCSLSAPDYAVSEN
jgi:hypothetical protein